MAGQLKHPVMYVSLASRNADIAVLHAWANRNPSTSLSPLIIPLQNTGETATPDCFTS